MFKKDETYFGFKLIKTENVDDINSLCHVFMHEKSGARLFYAQNDDKNKVFFISFKTPPENDCGTAHIMEHSVLCGSEKYPLKDPFNELEKGSLNTYLNALTYSDKTMYPVASVNDKDFDNLVRVYADAVFKPNVLKEEKIFKQEGWHYELESAQGEIKYNGVVFNEMKGALSQPERVLENCASRSLFGFTPYGYESGGDPDKITDLTYQGFKDFYNKYYYPSNSYIYLYGDMDIEKYLKFLDEEYLCNYKKSEQEIIINEVNKPYKEYDEALYSVIERDKDLKDSYFSLNYCTGKSTDILLQFGMEILSYILFETNGSPVKKAAVESGLCGDLEGWFDNSTYQMTLNIVGKKCRYEDRFKFKDLITEKLKELAQNGIDKNHAVSAINYIEFLLREADFGYKPKGLAYGMRMMYGYLHGKDPVESIKMWKYFDEIRNNVDNGFFENLIKEYLINNSHFSYTVIKAQEGLQAEIDRRTEAELKKFKESLSHEQIEKLIKDTEELKEYQDQEESEENLNKIPFISVNEVEKKSEPLNSAEYENGISVFDDTNSIEYIKIMFDLNCLPQDMIPYAGLLAKVLCKIDTKKYSYEALPSEMDMNTGGIYSTVDIYESPDGLRPVLAINGKALERNRQKLFELFEEIMVNSDFTKVESLKKIIRELIMRNETVISENGHSYSVLRALSYIRPASAYKEMVKGIAFNDFVIKAEKNIEYTAQKLLETYKAVITKDNFVLCTLWDKKNNEKSIDLYSKLNKILPEGKKDRFKFDFASKIFKEAVTNSSKIVYNAKGADFALLRHSYSGAMNVVRNIINTEYLWNQVRVKNGAYGAGCAMLRNGSIYAYSYRDPNTVKTFEAYNMTGNFLRQACGNIDIDKFILGAINDIDRPKSCSDKIETAALRYMQKISPDMVQKSRDEILSAGSKDILLCADIFDDAMNNAASVTIGSKSIIENSGSYYDTIRNLIAGEIL